MAAISIREISKSFGDAPVLRDIAIDIADGEFVTLLGPSGCGKSTLLRLIAGLETPDSGTVLVDGLDVTALPPKARDVAMVFQSYALYPHLTVRENMAVPLLMRRLRARQRLPIVGRFLPGTRAALAGIERDIQRVADALDIRPLLARKPGQLSGGQRQRVAVGRAMVRDPKAFLMDEPLSNLDAKLRVQLRTELSQLHRTLATTFVYVTHDQTEAMTMSDRIAVMIGGRILQLGTPDEIYRLPANLQVAEFVGSPRINLIDGRFDGERLWFAGGSLRLRAEADSPAALRLGFRCESASLADTEAADLRGDVVHIENLGSDVLVHVRTLASAAPVIVRIPPAGRAPRLGEQVGIATGDQLHLFGADGRRIGAEVGRECAPARILRPVAHA